MSLKMKTHRHGRARILKITGDITGQDAAKIHGKLESLTKSHKGPVAVDLSETTFIDSHGLGVLIYIWKRLEDSQRELVFLNPAPFVEEMLTSTKLDRVFKVASSVDDL